MTAATKVSEAPETLGPWGIWTFVAESVRIKKHGRFVVVRCPNGHEKTKKLSNLRMGLERSCTACGRPAGSRRFNSFYWRQ